MREVAGDCYDFLNVSESSTTILMADVSGRGVPAALSASMVKVAAASSGAAVADRLLVYTDGVLEATDKSGSFFGDERFHATIACHATKSCAELGASILDEMTRWSGNPVGFNDDVTLIVVEVN